MTITATELKKNLGYYLNKAEEERITVTKNGKEAVILSPARSSSLSFLTGLLEDFGTDLLEDEEIKWEYLKYE